MFYGANYTCYVEGGANDHSRSPDAIFWSNILGLFRPDLKFVMLPRGGKPEVEALARQIVSENIQNAVAAIDTDYDEPLNERILDARVLYTFGYSWENDALDKIFLHSIVAALARLNFLSDDQANHLSLGLSRLEKFASRLIVADFIALTRGSSIIPRKSSGRIIKACKEHGFPYADRNQIISIIKESKKKFRNSNVVKTTSFPDGLRHMVGHCYFYAITIIIHASLKYLGVRRNFTPEHIADIALAKIQEHFRMNHSSPIAMFHNNQCAAIPLAHA